MNPAPPAGLAGPEPGLAGQLQAAVGLGQPERHGGRPGGCQGLLQHGGGDAGSVRRELGGGAGQRDPGRRDAGQGRAPADRDDLAGDLRRQLENARPRLAGQGRELLLGLRGGAAQPLHQHAPGQVDHGTGGGLGLQPVQLTPLPGDEGAQPEELSATGCGHGRPSWGGAQGASATGMPR